MSRGAVSLVADDPAVAPMLEDLPQLVAEITEQIESGDHAGAAEVREFAGAGHPIQAEQPERFAEAINTFVREHTA